VAIAVSLVPPLATVGICLELGRVEDAGGALLLFLTNFSAIVVVACVVFMLVGAGPSRALLRERRRVRIEFLAATVILVIIAIPLVADSVARVQVILKETGGAPIVLDWIDGRDLVVTSWLIDGSDVTLEVKGPDAPPDAAPLAAELAAQFGQPVDLTVNYTRVESEGASAAP